MPLNGLILAAGAGVNEPVQRTQVEAPGANNVGGGGALDWLMPTVNQLGQIGQTAAGLKRDLGSVNADPQGERRKPPAPNAAQLTGEGHEPGSMAGGLSAILLAVAIGAGFGYLSGNWLFAILIAGVVWAAMVWWVG